MPRSAAPASGVIRWIASVAGRAGYLTALLLAVQSVLALCGVGYALILRALIDAATAGQTQTFVRSAIWLVGLMAFQIVLRAVDRHLSEYTRATLENRFKARLFQTLLRKDYAAVSAVHSGEWLNRLTSDTAVTADTLAQVIPNAAGMLVRLIAAAAVLLRMEPRLAAIILPAGIVLALLATVFRRTLKRLHKRIQEANGRLRIYLQDCLSSLLVVRIFGREKAVSADADARMDAHRQARMARTRFSNLCNVGFSAAMYGFLLVGVIYCGSGILHGTMSYGVFAAVQQLITQIQGPFANLTGYLPRFYAMLASAERLMEAEAFAPDSTETMPEEQTLHFYQTELQSLQLEHVCFTYQPPVQTEGEPPAMPVVLQDVSLTVRKGEYVVFTGPSGCGKSTLLKLLMCLYPLDSGQRFLSTKTGNQPLTPAWKSLFAYVPQGNQLLSGSIRSIVAFGDEDRAQDENAIYNALKIACADDFVRRLENGLDTVLGERGAGLSEGQMQRIAIARAVYSNHPILLLDEATSALDEATALRLLNNLRKMTDKTVILVTHRMNQAGFFDAELAFSKDGICVRERKTCK